MKSGCFAIALSCAVLTTPALAAPAYTLTKTISLGAPDRWDYVVFDVDTGRVYIAHGDRLSVFDGRSGALVGQVLGVAGGTHGIAISHATGQGFTDDGRSGQAIVFDLGTLAITHRIAADVDADAVTIDRATGHVFVVEGDPGKISVIDPATNKMIATITGGEKMEYAVADDQGTIFVAGEEKGDLLKIDARTNTVVARWPAPGCESPHGLALDKAQRRLFMGCVNAVLMVIDADTGGVVTKLPIGKGSDAIAYDPRRKRVFSSNGVDGTLSVYQQTAADEYAPLEPIPTAVGGRTMAVDPDTGRLFVAAADTDPHPAPDGRPRAHPGSPKLLFLDPRD